MIYWRQSTRAGRNCADRGQWPQRVGEDHGHVGVGAGPTWVAENFDSVNPATSEVIGTYPVQGRSEVDAVVERARQAASWWAGLTYQQRRTRLLAWKSHITRYLARLAELVHTETGKPLADAQLEILLAIVHIDWAAKNAGRVLGPRRVRSGLIAINQASRLEYQPLGVVGVIGPWNYPVFTPHGVHRLRARRGQRGGVQAE